MPSDRTPRAVDTYRLRLRQLSFWDDYLRQESCLPGPRANLELLEAVIGEGDRSHFEHLLGLDASFAAGAPPDTPDEFLTVCGVAGLGKLVAQGDRSWLAELRRFAADGRWRVREAVAIALQHWGDNDMSALVEEMQAWSHASWLEQRAVVAGLAEPRLLHQCTGSRSGPHLILLVIAIFDTIMQAVVDAAVATRRSPDYRILRQALAYAWSVLVVADPDAGLPAFERWLIYAASANDKDALWIVRRNLKKRRLIAMDPAWTAGWTAHLG